MNRLEKSNHHPSARLVIQGVKGSYSFMAAKKIIEKRHLSCGELVFARSFDEAFSWLDEGKAAYAVLPYKNTLVGPVTTVYSRLSCYRLWETISLPINHCLATVFSCSSPNQLRKVYSHPVALAQCRGLFKKYPHFQPCSFEDTAAAAAWVARKSSPSLGAICSEEAARIFKLQPLLKRVQDRKDNRTFFALISLF